MLDWLLQRGGKGRPRSVRLELMRADGALVLLDFEPESVDSISRLLESMRDPVETSKRLDEAERARDYWQERCLKAEAEGR